MNVMMHVKDYLSLLRDQGASPETIKAYSSDLAQFSNFLKEQKLRITQVTRNVVGQWKEQMQGAPNPRFSCVGFKPASISRRVGVASCFFDYVSANNPRIRNPFRFRVGRKSHPKPRDHYGKAIDDVSLDTLLGGIENLRDRTLISLFVTSGLRLSEVWQLDVTTLEKIEEDCDDGMTRIWGKGRVLGKGSKERTFYFDDVTVALVEQYLATRTDHVPALFVSERKQRLSKRAIQDVLATWCRKLGLQRYHVHQLRHCFATKLAEAKIDGLVLRDLLGHSQFDTTLRYISLAESTHATEYFAAMERLRNR